MSSRSFDRVTTAVEAPPGQEANTPVLAIPEGWVIDDLAYERLVRQLAHAPNDICGVAAETGALPSGASYRVHAERLCLRPLSAAAESSRHAVRGAVLVRHGVGFEVRDDVVEVERGSLLVDPGAHAHDPWRAITALEPASPLGRPPFPRRPVVVFLACEPDVEVLDWARSLVNNLVRRDVEGRLAMLDIAEGLHLTQPCLPSEESVRALSPDVIVALDQTALDQAPAWCGTDRSVVVVEFTPDVAATAELIPWQLERAQGRLRARIGRQINAPTLVSLVNRLCSGPHPFPPIDAAKPTAAVATVRALLTRRPAPLPNPGTRRSVVVLTGGRDPADDPALSGLVDHLVGAGHAAEMLTVGRGNASAERTADLVVIGSAANEDESQKLIEARRLARQPTIANIEPLDVLSDTWSRNEAPQLVAASAQLATSCGSAMTESTAVHSLLRSLDLRVHLLPPLLTRRCAAELRSARGGRSPHSDAVIGWYVGSASTPTPDYAEAVAEAVREVLAERALASVEIVGEPARVPAGLLEHPKVSVLPDRPDGEAISRWTVHLWCPPVADDGAADEIRSFVEASAVGVPTVLPKPIQTGIGGHPSPRLLVEFFHQPDDWIAPLRRLLDDEVAWSTQSRAAIGWFDAMHGPAATDVAVNRFLGWALSKEEQQ